MGLENKLCTFYTCLRSRTPFCRRLTHLHRLFLSVSLSVALSLSVSSFLYLFLSPLSLSLSACLTLSASHSSLTPTLAQQPIFRKLDREDVTALSTRALNLLTVLLSSSISETSSLQEDSLMAMSALLEGMREHTAQCIDFVKPYVLAAVENVQHSQV